MTKFDKNLGCYKKVGSSYACPLVEMTEFFNKVKEYAPKIVSLILPAPTSLTTAPGTSVSAPTDPAAAIEVA
jgi:hypothetical protein